MKSEGLISFFSSFSLGPLARKVQEQHVQDIIVRLSNHILNEKTEETRDIASTALKTVISDIPTDSVNIVRLIVKTLTPKLITAIGVCIIFIFGLILKLNKSSENFLFVCLFVSPKRRKKMHPKLLVFVWIF
jgi:hypothetical protein